MIQEEARTVAPHSQFGIVTAESTDDIDPDIECDMSLQEPLPKPEFRDLIDRLVHRALYIDGLREFYQTVDRLSNIEHSDTDGSANELRSHLQQETRDLSEYLDGLKVHLEPEDYTAVIESVKDDSKHFEQSLGPHLPLDVFSPDECPNCNVPWDEGPEETEDRGYTTIGPFTWKCTACETVKKAPSSGSQTTAR